MKRPKTVSIQANGRTIGTYFPGLKLFQKRVNGSQHLYRELDAWAIDEAAIKAVIAKGCQRIEVFDRESRILYTLKPQDFLSKASPLVWGHGRQMAVARSLWIQKYIKIKRQ